MKITAVEPQKTHNERVNVYVDGAFRFALAAALLFDAGLHTGDDISAARIAELEALDQQWKAREAALNLLSFRPRTQVELRRRLLQKGFEEAVVEPVVAGLAGYGLVDDQSFAETFVRDRVRLRPRGRRRLVRELRAKGVDTDTAQEAVAEVMQAEDVSDVDLAREAAARWSPRRGEDPQRARRRLYGFLARRGFGGDAVRTVMDEVLAPE